jgi:hypothetical protein
MKNSMCIIVLILLAVLAFFSQAAMGADDGQPTVGGWKKISITDKEVVDSLAYLGENFPVITVEKVHSAYVQVVAGLNVKLICTIAGLGEEKKWEIIVYKDLEKNFHFTSAKYARP